MTMSLPLIEMTGASIPARERLGEAVLEAVTWMVRAVALQHGSGFPQNDKKTRRVPPLPPPPASLLLVVAMA